MRNLSMGLVFVLGLCIVERVESYGYIWDEAPKEAVIAAANYCEGVKVANN